MPGKLIYRCGRFLDQGYVTLIGGELQSTGDRAADDAIWRGLREGKALAGSIGHVWTVLSEGRDVTDVLAFVHGVKLPAAVESQIKARLRSLADDDLPATLAKVRQDGLAPTAARGMLIDLLDRTAAELSALVPAGPSRSAIGSAPKNAPRGKWGIAWATALVTLAVIGIAGVAFWPSGNDRAGDTQGPSRDEIVKVAKACYPDLTEGQQEFDRLVQAIGTADWRDEDSAVRDYLRALPDGLRDQVAQPDIEAGKLCDARRKMWEQAGALRRGLDGMGDALDAARMALGNDKRDLPAMRLMTDVQAFLSDSPIPDPPGDCAAGMCLPLVDPADINLKRWMDALLGEMARSLNAAAGEVAIRLRNGEVILRGELSLAGAPQAADLPGLFASLWSCRREPVCDLPLRDATDWLMLR